MYFHLAIISSNNRRRRRAQPASMRRYLHSCKRNPRTIAHFSWMYHSLNQDPNFCNYSTNQIWTSQNVSLLSKKCKLLIKSIELLLHGNFESKWIQLKLSYGCLCEKHTWSIDLLPLMFQSELPLILNIQSVWIVTKEIGFIVYLKVLPGLLELLFQLLADFSFSELYTCQLTFLSP